MIELWSDAQIRQVLSPERTAAIWLQSPRDEIDYNIEGAEIKFVRYEEVTDARTRLIVEVRDPAIRSTLFAAIDYDGEGNVGAIRQVRQFTEMKPVTTWVPVRGTW